MLPFDEFGKRGPKIPLPDNVRINEPKDEEPITAPFSQQKDQEKKVWFSFCNYSRLKFYFSFFLAAADNAVAAADAAAAASNRPGVRRHAPSRFVQIFLCAIFNAIIL